MNDFFQTIYDLIIHNRQWSWSVIGLVYVTVTLIIRSWFLKPMISIAKELKRVHYTEIKEAYVKRALAGWIFYIAALVMVLIVWSRSMPPSFTAGQNLILGIAAGLYILSVVLHVQAIAIAGYQTLKKTEVA